MSFFIFKKHRYDIERPGPGISDRDGCVTGEVALHSSLQSKWHRLGQAVVIENKDSNASAVFEAKSRK